MEAMIARLLHDKGFGVYKEVTIDMRGKLILTALASLLAVFLSGASLAQPQGGGCDARCFAASLMEQIPEGERIALIPFGPPRTAIPQDEAEAMYKVIVTAMLQEKRRRGHEVVSRDLDNVAWESWQVERDNPLYAELWKQRRVQVTVHCTVMGVDEHGVSLLCRAIPVGGKLKGEVAGDTAFLRSGKSFLPYRHGLTDVALRLIDRETKPGTIEKVFFVDNDVSRQTKLAVHMGKEIRRVAEDVLRARIGQRRATQAFQQATGVDADTTSRVRRYEIRGALGWLNDQVSELRVRLLDGEEEVSSATLQMQRKWLPANLIHAGTGRMRYSATGEAFLSGGWSRVDAEWAARNAARARIVAQATGGASPDLPEMRNARHSLEALRRALELGVPTGERIQGQWEHSPDVVAVEMVVRTVKKVGAATRPAFKARLTRDTVRAGEDMYIHLSAEETVHVSVFGWGADHNVFRVFPRDERELVVPAEGTMVLPRPEDRIVLESAPLPGRAEDHEAVLVVAATGRLPFRGLAPLLGGPTGGDALKPVDGTEFLERLGRLDLRRASLTVLPYTVSR